MATAEHREPCDSRGSRTVLGAPGGEIPPGDSTKCEELRVSIMNPLPPQLPTFERHRFSTAAVSPHRIGRSDGERSDRAC
jgi:hypothetical protein